MGTRGNRSVPSDQHTQGKPHGIPKGWEVKPSRSGGGMRYVDLNNLGNSVRVMPGNSNSSYPNLQQPYVRWISNGQSLNSLGQVVHHDTADAHIPLQQFRLLPEVYLK